MFWKRNSYSDSCRATSTQTIVNAGLSEQCKTETREKDSETDSERESIHSKLEQTRIPVESK